MLALVTTARDPSEAIRIEMARARMTGTKTAQRAGIAYSTWRRRMDNPKTWRIGELRKVAAALDIPLSRLTAEEDEQR